MKPYTSTELLIVRQQYSNYSWNSRRRGLDFALTFEEYIDIVSRNCYYCDAPPRPVYNKKNKNYFAFMNGVDRYDNKIGYLLYNTRPCCSSCNYLKGSLDGDKFIAKVKSIMEVIYGKDST